MPVTISYQAQTKNTTVQTDEGTEITLGAFAKDKGFDDTTLNYRIQWNDPNNPGAYNLGTTSWDTLFTFNYTYHENGTYYPVLTVTDSDGGYDTLNFTVIVNNIAPTVNAGSNIVVNEGATVNFSGTFTDPGAYDTHTATWDWGDLTSGTGTVTEENLPPDATGTITGSHVYLDDGIYYPKLTVNDDDGDSGQDTLTVTVNDLAPLADFKWAPQTQDEGYGVQFTDLSSSYPDSISAWSWNFGGLGTSTQQNPLFTFMDDGIYSVSLLVTDDDGSTDSISYSITISDLAPDADFSWSPDPQGEGSPVQFTDQSTSYPDVLVSRAWVFGDGGSSSQQNPSHIYVDNGAYTVNLKVTDDDGSFDTVSSTVTIYNVAPIVNAGTDQTINEGGTVIFSGSFTDPGLLDTHTFVWDFGDGTTSSSSLTPSHAYGDDGVFKVTLTVTDNDGGVGVDNIFVTVNNVAPSVYTTGKTVTLNENVPFNISAIATDPGSDDLTLSWNFELGPTIDNIYFNNGISPDPASSPDLNPINISDIVNHNYGDNGVFNVTLTVTDDDGGSTSTTIKITVNNVAPSIVYIDAYIIANITLRAAGEKWHSVSIHLYDDDNEIWTANLTRYPGDPDNQSATLSDFKVALNKSYTAIVDYIPNDPSVNGNVWGGNSVWIDLDFYDGTSIRLHHTFNVRQSDWKRDHWNLIDPWEVDFTPIFAEQHITFKAIATDPGSDDLIFDWDFGDGNSSGSKIYYNNGISPDTPKSPDVAPMNVTDTTSYKYSASGNYTVTLTVKDDDGGSIPSTLILTITVA
jgi:PKD repeat protein